MLLLKVLTETLNIKTTFIHLLHYPLHVGLLQIREFLTEAFSSIAIPFLTNNIRGGFTKKGKMAAISPLKLGMFSSS